MKPGTMESLGEAGIISKLRDLFPAPASGVGIGDDMAVIPMPGSADDLLLGSDATLQDRHFTAATPLIQVGHKALGRVLSDVAAMGGTPRWALLDLVLPPTLDDPALTQLLEGIASLAADHGVTIVGGDTSQGESLQLHAFAAATVPSGQALLRSGAQAGDLLYVTGSLGGSPHGGHLDFKPRVAEGQQLIGIATAAIDISDGLGTDARHIAEESGVHIILQRDHIPLATGPDGEPVAVESALCDGEDFELLFAVAPDKAAALEAGWQGPAPLTRIGTATADRPGVSLRTGADRFTPLHQSGYQHFAGKSS